MRSFVVGLICIALALGLMTGQALAVSGQCVNCHTMHNSQDGSPVNPSGPNPNLLIDDCLGCHAQATTSTIVNDTPQVAPSGVNTLAGGSFNGVATDDTLGHNVLGIAAADGTLGTNPPGYDVTLATHPYPGTQLSCAGTSGCHGDRTVNGSADGGDDLVALKGAHHSNASGSVPGTSLGASYRFLNGTLGYEDPMWEDPTTLSSTVHNQYYGAARTTEALTAGTISAVCADCHGQFHNGTGNISTTFSSPWLRHPTDMDLGDATGTEYQYYNGGTGTGNTYSTAIPVASTDVSAVLGTVNPGSADGTAIVMCLSCHRAHGSNYPDSLRFDYTAMISGGGPSNEGCFVCHTTKDE